MTIEAKVIKLIFILTLTAVFTAGAFAQTKSAETITPALGWSESDGDGCTWFPDGNYRDCCVAHDRAYFFGGSSKQRRHADQMLFQCVWAKPKFYNKLVAPVIWLGVRVGGVSWLNASFSWGFGKKKKKISDRITKLADKKAKKKKKTQS